MREIVAMLDENLSYLTHELYEDYIVVVVESSREEVECPYCGKRSSRVHSTYERSFQDLPIQGKKVFVSIINRKYFCENHNCLNKTFAESFDFLKSKSKKSERLINQIMKLSTEVSSVTASRMLKDGVVDVSKSTICDMLKKTIKALDKESVERICIDDFALKRRYRYGTVMIDIDNGRIVDILESRETNDVAKWLALYPNIRVVSRDGSQQYAAAIRQAHPDAIQVSDRFHLIKNLTDYAKQCISKIVLANFRIPSGDGEPGIDVGYWEKPECHSSILLKSIALLMA